MITIKIGVSELQFANVTEIDNNWINQQIRLQRTNGHVSCIRVSINEASFNLTLTTVGCPSGGGGRLPNQEETKIFEIWNDIGLGGNDVNEHMLIAFFRRIRRLLD